VADATAMVAAVRRLPCLTGLRRDSMCPLSAFPGGTALMQSEDAVIGYVVDLLPIGARRSRQAVNP